MTGVWDTAPCSLVEIHPCLTHRPYGEISTHVWNVDLLRRDYTALYPRRLSTWNQSWTPFVQFLLRRSDWLWNPAAYYPVSIGSVFPLGKAAWAWSWPFGYSAEVSAWIFTFSPATHLYGVVLRFNDNCVYFSLTLTFTLLFSCQSKTRGMTRNLRWCYEIRPLILLVWTLCWHSISFCFRYLLMYYNAVTARFSLPFRAPDNNRCHCMNLGLLSWVIFKTHYWLRQVDNRGSQISMST
jgi:hypothetical protein